MAAKPRFWGVLALLAANGALHAQECMWSPSPITPPDGPEGMAYDSVAQRILVMGPVLLDPMRLWGSTSNGWALLSSNGPPRRFNFGLAFDTARNRLVLFGGSTNPVVTLGDTWEWDGVAWMLVSNTGPSAREGVALVYDAARQRTLLFGGRSYPAYYGDTWEWNGSAWLQRVASGPSPRWEAAAGYDVGRGRVVLFGGSDNADTWEWDGNAWTQRPGPGPGPRSGGAMVYDPVRNRMVLHGGNQRSTWEFAGATGTWVLRTAVGPGSWGFVFDPVRSIGVMIGYTYDEWRAWEWRGNGSGEPALIVQAPESQYAPLGGSASFHVGAVGTAPVIYQWRRGGLPLTNGGNISGADTAVLVINPVGVGDYGTYSVAVTNACGSEMSAGASLNPSNCQCYANCDCSGTPPVLNVADFGCFLGAFAAGLSYANCDGSTGSPLLTVLDFACFLNRYAAGCSAP
jgi:Immunoglobulin I-set domain